MCCSPHINICVPAISRKQQVTITSCQRDYECQPVQAATMQPPTCACSIWDFRSAASRECDSTWLSVSSCCSCSRASSDLTVSRRWLATAACCCAAESFSACECKEIQVLTQTQPQLQEFMSCRA